MNRCLPHAIAVAIGVLLIKSAAAQEPRAAIDTAQLPPPGTPAGLPSAAQVLDVLKHANGEATTAPKGAVVTAAAPGNPTGDSLFFQTRTKRDHAAKAQQLPTHFVPPAAVPQ